MKAPTTEAKRKALTVSISSRTDDRLRELSRLRYMTLSAVVEKLIDHEWEQSRQRRPRVRVVNS